MADYQPIFIVSGRLNSTEADLLSLRDRHWIGTVEKNGITYISVREAYKARFILHLRRLQVTDEEIGTVLDTLHPPYSLQDVRKMLGRPIGA